jgi:hypothetical protein
VHCLGLNQQEARVKAALLSGWVALAVAGCGSGTTTVVTPAAVEDNFFVTWELSSATFGPIDCFAAGASTVDMDIVNASTGERFVDTFACEDFQGTSQPVSVGNFDVLLSLSDGGGGLLSQVDIGTENISTAGTIDLGHVIFQLP